MSKRKIEKSERGVDKEDKMNTAMEMSILDSALSIFLLSLEVGGSLHLTFKVSSFFFSFSQISLLSKISLF